MGQAKIKKVLGQLGTNGQPMGRNEVSSSGSPPLLKGGESSEGLGGAGGDEKHQSGRERLNLSLSPKLRGAVAAVADTLGMTDSQVVVYALVQALPELERQAAACRDLGRS